MKRSQQRRPGHDCMYAPCKHDPEGDHGISGGHFWWGVVADEGDVAVVLGLHAQDYPETIPAAVRERMIREGATDSPLGAVDYHSNAPVDREQMLTHGLRTKPDDACDYLGVPCFNAGCTYLGVDAFTAVVARDEQGRILYDQPEAFWAALEAKLTEKAPGIRADMAEAARWKVCPTCHGDQTMLR